MSLAFNNINLFREDHIMIKTTPGLTVLSIININMETDCQKARARFIDKTVQLWEKLSFVIENKILKASQVLFSDAYGSMLWKLGSDISAGSLPHKPNEADSVQILQASK